MMMMQWVLKRQNNSEKIFTGYCPSQCSHIFHLQAIRIRVHCCVSRPLNEIIPVYFEPKSRIATIMKRGGRNFHSGRVSLMTSWTKSKSISTQQDCLQFAQMAHWNYEFEMEIQNEPEGRWPQNGFNQWLLGFPPSPPEWRQCLDVQGIVDQIYVIGIVCLSGLTLCRHAQLSLACYWWKESAKLRNWDFIMGNKTSSKLRQCSRHYRFLTLHPLLLSIGKSNGFVHTQHWCCTKRLKYWGT